MKKIKFIFLLFFISEFMYSCYSPRYVYSPSVQNIPLLNKKNELEFSAYYSGSPNFLKEKNNSNNAFDIQAAWAFSNHFAVMINEGYGKEKNNSNDSYFANDSSLLSYKKNFIEMGIGYFTLAKYNAKMQFQLFGGAAFGSSKITDDFISNNIYTAKYHNSRVTKIFLQPAIIYSPVNNFTTALSSRFTEIIFTHIHTNYTATELDNYILDSLTVSPVFFWEPAMSYTFGFKKIPVKLRIQGSITVLLNHRFIEHKTGIASIGIVADISKKKIKNQSPKN